MKKYKVILHPDAEVDINSAFAWGRRTWGEESAMVWVRKLRHTFRSRLASVPLGYNLAPESAELGISVRNLIVGRYRILFIVKRKTVTILHVRGPSHSPASFELKSTLLTASPHVLHLNEHIDAFNQ